MVRRLAIIGAGWAGLAAAVRACERGDAVTVFEAARLPGGRARTLPVDAAEGGTLRLDNGQHILVAAYRETLALMQQVGLDPDVLLLRLPLALRFPDGGGLALPDLRPPWDAVAGIARARGWHWRDKVALLLAALRWRLESFACPPSGTVADLARELTPRVRDELLEPLCVAALNTPAQQASGQVFLRVLQDALFGTGHAGWAGSNLLLPRTDLGALFPQAAVAWLQARGASVQFGRRVQAIAPAGPAADPRMSPDAGRFGGAPTQPAAHHPQASAGARWWVDGDAFDAVVLACPPWEAARLVTGSHAGEAAAAPAPAARATAAAAPGDAHAPTGTAAATARPGVHAAAGPPHAAAWLAAVQALRYEPIATVYASGGPALPLPMLALRGGPAQFVFDRGQLGGPPGVLAFVASAVQGERAALEQAVLAQARALGWSLRPLQTVVEKRATFACTPGLDRPGLHIAPGLVACGDYVEGPYPATLEGAVRSARLAIDATA